MIHYDQTGSNRTNPPLVFVHGLTCAADDWQKQLDALAPTHRCISVDLRGHGRSAAMRPIYDMETLAADVVAILRQHELRNSVLIGHSMGTRVITAACLQAPEYCAGLVYVDGSKQASGDPQAAAAAVVGKLSRDADVPAFIGNMFAAMFTGNSDDDERQSIIDRAVAMPPSVFRALLTQLLQWDAGRMISALQQVDIPVCVVQSTNVDENRVRHGLSAGQTTPYLQLLQQHLRRVDIQIAADAGHFTQLDAADHVVRAISALAAAIEVD